MRKRYTSRPTTFELMASSFNNIISDCKFFQYIYRILVKVIFLRKVSGVEQHRKKKLTSYHFIVFRRSNKDVAHVYSQHYINKAIFF